MVVVVVVVVVNSGVLEPHNHEMVVVRALATRNWPACRFPRLPSLPAMVSMAPVLTFCSGGSQGPASLVGPPTSTSANTWDMPPASDLRQAYNSSKNWTTTGKGNVSDYAAKSYATVEHMYCTFC